MSEVPTEAEFSAALDVVRRYLEVRGELPAVAAAAPALAGGAESAARSCVEAAVPGGDAGAASDARRVRSASPGVETGPAMVLAGTPPARLRAFELSRDSESDVVFDFNNPGAGDMTLQVDGVDVVTTATDEDTTYSAGNQLQLSGTTFDVLEGSGSGLDADTLDGLDSTGFLTAGADPWVDESGDSMSGNLQMAGNAITTVGDLGLNDTATVTKNSARFLWDDGALGSLSLGRAALENNTSGAANTGLGHSALQSNGTGGSNTAVGWNAMRDNADGSDNTAIGNLALAAGTSNSGNTAVGSGALADNDTGDGNTAVGASALQANTVGFDNVAVGRYALSQNVGGTWNAALGSLALSDNTTGIYNTAVGGRALAANTSGNQNVAVGEEALVNSESGHNNVVIGQAAMLSNTTGSDNIAIGSRALYMSSTGTANIAIGRDAGFVVDGSSNISIGNSGVAGESNTIRIGSAGSHTRAFLAGVYGVELAGTVETVVADANGQLGTVASGSGSGLNADLLDGIDSTGFLTAGTDLWVDTTGDTMSGTLALSPAMGLALVVGGPIELGGDVLRGGSVFLNTNGGGSTGFGHNALAMSAGSRNTAVGRDALVANTFGANNTAIGYRALAGNVTGTSNTAVGRDALLNNAGDLNTAVGGSALFSNTVGASNTAIGTYALYANTDGIENVALGRHALGAAQSGNYNTAVGAWALATNDYGATTPRSAGARCSRVPPRAATPRLGRARSSRTPPVPTARRSAPGPWPASKMPNNTAVGHQALTAATTGGANSALGQRAPQATTTGDQNTAVGVNALYSNQTGRGNIAIGYRAGFSTTGDYNIAIGHQGEFSDFGVIRIGVPNMQVATFVAGIHSVTPGGGNILPVVIDDTGQLGTTSGGIGSGLDADLLDGLDSTAFVPATGGAIKGNLDVVGGLDVTCASLTVGGSKFTVDPASGETNVGGPLRAEVFWLTPLSFSQPIWARRRTSGSCTTTATKTASASAPAPAGRPCLVVPATRNRRLRGMAVA